MNSPLMASGKAPKGYTGSQMSNYTPQQMQLFESLLGGLGGGVEGATGFLSKLASGDEGLFQQLEKPGYEAFNQQLGNIGTRFSNLGARDSSAFRNATAGAAGDFASQLQSNRVGLQKSAVDSLLNNSSSLLNNQPYSNFLTPKKENKSLELIGQLLPAIIAAFKGG